MSLEETAFHLFSQSIPCTDLLVRIMSLRQTSHSRTLRTHSFTISTPPSLHSHSISHDSAASRVSLMFRRM